MASSFSGGMKKYRHVFSIGIQNNLTYRFNYLTRTLFSFIPLFAMLSLWRTVYANKNGSPSGFTASEIVFYYILVAIVDVFTAVNEDDWQIANDIREGAISQFLLKPIDYLWYRVFLFFAGRAAYISMACVRSEEHTSELQSRQYLVCRLLLEKKNVNSTDDI